MAGYEINLWEYTLRVYETSKAHEQGFYKWDLLVTHDVLPDYPEMLKSSDDRYMTLDQALMEVVHAFYDDAGNFSFLCSNCESGTQHRLKSVVMNEEGDLILVYLQCKCGTNRTKQYFVKVIA